MARQFNENTGLSSRIRVRARSRIRQAHAMVPNRLFDDKIGKNYFLFVQISNMECIGNIASNDYQTISWTCNNGWLPYIDQARNWSAIYEYTTQSLSHWRRVSSLKIYTTITALLGSSMISQKQIEDINLLLKKFWKSLFWK